MLKTSILLISMGAFSATLVGLRPMGGPVDEPNHKTSDLSVSVGNAKRLEVHVPLGEITLIADNSRDLTVHIDRSAGRPLDREARRWLNDSTLIAENRNGVLTVRDRPFGKDSISQLGSGDSKGSDRKGRDLNLRVVIHAPSDLAAKLDVSAGEAQVQGRFRSLEAGIGAGKLTSDFVQCKGDVVLHVGAGEVDAKIPAGANTDVKADVAMGEITGLPSGAKRESGLHFGDHRHGKTGQGDSKLNIHVGAGSIKVESRDRILASTNVDTEQAADDESIEIIENRDDYGIGKSVDASVRAALAATRDALRNTNIDTKIELGDLKIDDLGDLKGLDADLAKELAKIGPEIERAMKTAQPEIEKAMKSIGPEIERAMKDAKPDFDRAMKAMHPEIEKAIKMAKLEIAKAMKSVKPEVDRALREALKEIEKAEKELKSHRND